MSESKPCARGHAWTPLWTGWEPDVTTPCDCGEATWGEHQRALMQARASRARWDVAKGALTCRSSAHTTTRPHIIGAGEPFRRVTPHDWPYCADCALKRLDESPPADLPVITYADRLAPPAEDRPDPPAAPSQVTVTRDSLQPTKTPDPWWEA